MEEVESEMGGRLTKNEGDEVTETGSSVVPCAPEQSFAAVYWRSLKYLDVSLFVTLAEGCQVVAEPAFVVVLKLNCTEGLCVPADAHDR